MQLKFNNGRGALCCEKCNIIIIENFKTYEWETLLSLNTKDYKWYCNKCEPSLQTDQQLDFLNELDLIKHNFIKQNDDEAKW